MGLGTFGDSPSFLPGNAGNAPGSMVTGGSAQLPALTSPPLNALPTTSGPRTVTTTGVSTGEVLGSQTAIHNLPDGKLNVFST